MNYKPRISNRLRKHEMPFSCMALTDTGKPCKCYPVNGEAFCLAHLKQGYGLFTLAVLSAIHKKP